MGSVSQFRPPSPRDNEVASVGEVFSDSDRNELRKIIQERSFKTGIFTLSSGHQSNLYFNMKPTMMDSRGAVLAALAFIALMHQTESEYVSGLEMGAVPVIGAMAAVGTLIGCPIRTTFVRKRKKEHGTKEMIEGLGPEETLRGKKVFVIDDVATSGKSILQAIQEVRAAGGIVTSAAALVNRNEGGDQLMRLHNVMLYQVFSGAEIAEGYI